MKIVKIVAQWLFILSIPALLLTASLGAAMNSRALYEYGFNKYDISRVTGLAPAELTKAANGLISYFNSGEEYINVTVIKNGQPFALFKEREVQHLKDVKSLFWLDYKVLIGAGVYALVFVAVTLFWWRDKRRLGWGLLGGGGLTLFLMAALGIIIALDFDQFFLQFHLLSFANDFWQLNPATDYLLMMFPDGFWFDATLFCAIGTAAGAVILGGLGWWLRRKSGINKPR
ncbi:MAG: TIGR01906 family membrane protein [Dehalococcoidales bacterium]